MASPWTFRTPAIAAFSSRNEDGYVVGRYHGLLVSL